MREVLFFGAVLFLYTYSMMHLHADDSDHMQSVLGKIPSSSSSGSRKDFTSVSSVLAQQSSAALQTLQSTPHSLAHGHDSETSSFLVVSNNNSRSCQQYEEQIIRLSQASSRFRINQLRRQLFSSDFACYEKLLPRFEESFATIPTHKHLVLHIPKTGGTSLCGYVKHHTSLSVPKNPNCWPTLEYGPLWCCVDEANTHAHDVGCGLQERGWTGKHDFVMNENWLDELCEFHAHSILLREPVARAMSQWNHWTNHFLASNNPRYTHALNKPWRETLMQSNYMTWSLTAHRFGYDIAPDDIAQNNHPGARNKPYLFQPHNDTHLHEALDRLEQMDHLIDLNYHDQTCVETQLEFMGIYNVSSSDSRLRHLNQASSSHHAYTHEIRTSCDWTKENQLDTRVYQHAQKLLRADCDFMSRIKARRTICQTVGSQLLPHACRIGG